MIAQANRTKFISTGKVGSSKSLEVKTHRPGAEIASNKAMGLFAYSVDRKSHKLRSIINHNEIKRRIEAAQVTQPELLAYGAGRYLKTDKNLALKEPDKVRDYETIKGKQELQMSGATNVGDVKIHGNEMKNNEESRHVRKPMEMCVFNTTSSNINTEMNEENDYETIKGKSIRKSQKVAGYNKLTYLSSVNYDEIKHQATNKRTRKEAADEGQSTKMAEFHLSDEEHDYETIKAKRLEKLSLTQTEDKKTKDKFIDLMDYDQLGTKEAAPRVSMAAGPIELKNQRNEQESMISPDDDTDHDYETIKYKTKQKQIREQEKRLLAGKNLKKVDSGSDYDELKSRELTNAISEHRVSSNDDMNGYKIPSALIPKTMNLTTAPAHMIKYTAPCDDIIVKAKVGKEKPNSYAKRRAGCVIKQLADYDIKKNNSDNQEHLLAHQPVFGQVVLDGDIEGSTSNGKGDGNKDDKGTKEGNGQ